MLWVPYPLRAVPFNGMPCAGAGEVAALVAGPKALGTASAGMACSTLARAATALT